MAHSSTRHNLSVDLQGNNDGAIPGSAPVERIITVRNRGSELADIDLWIRPNDTRSELLLRWCTLFDTSAVSNEVARSSRNLAHQSKQGFSGLRLPQVEPQSSREVTLRFDVPAQAEPGFYSYDIMLQAPQYPDERSQRTQQLRVLATGQDVGLHSEPNWSVDPATSSDAPYSLKAGTTLQVRVTVTNRSDAVDRFYLSCPELDPYWFEPPLYPESNLDAPGFVARADGLMLNPGESGDIILEIHPPPHTPAGHYSSTIRLKSFNRENLVLLDIIYLKIEINDQLLVNLQPPVQKNPAAIESFHLFLTNPGNIIRALDIQSKDKDDIFTYRLTSDRVQLAPGESQTVDLYPKPKKWWRRAWRGQEQEIVFGVELFEAQLVENQSVGVLYLPEAATGKILWQSRPTWILRLLQSLLILLLLAGVCGLVYWLLRELVVKPSEEPKILEFSATEEAYQAGAGNPIRLDWKISNPDKNARAIVTYYASDGRDLLRQSYPLQTLNDTQDTCEAGTYQPNVLLRLIRRLYGREPNISTVSCIGIAPQPAAAENAVFETGEYQAKLEILPQSPSTPASEAANAQAFDSERLTNIKISPLPLPEILYFYSKTLIYRQTGVANSSTTNGSSVLPQYPAPPIQLNWIINNTTEVEALELNTVYITPNGTISSSQVRYTLQDGIPVGLGNLCRLQGGRLMCENVPTQAVAPGKYNFTLNVVMSTERGAARITKNSEAIEIRPQLPDIQSFMVNGTDVLQNPQLVQMINPARGAIYLDLNWQIANPDQVKVELLPAPGLVATSSNRLRYLLSPTPGSTTLTLQVTNQAGEVVSRSVVIQTAAYPPLPVPIPMPPSASGAPNAAGAAPGTPGVAAPGAPIDPNQLPPYELPPRAN